MIREKLLDLFAKANELKEPREPSPYSGGGRGERGGRGGYSGGGQGSKPAERDDDGTSYNPFAELLKNRK